MPEAPPDDPADLAPPSPSPSPYPPRASSAPLPPRKNALGLPPIYLHHLRTLLKQWLAQQVAPGPLPDSDDAPIWTDKELVRLERILWNDTIVTQPSGRTGLLELDWAGYATGSRRRKGLWKSQNEIKEAASSKASINETEGGSKLVIPPTPQLSSSPGLAPGRFMRTPSLASSTKSATKPDLDRRLSNGEKTDESDSEHRELEEWCTAIKSLTGYETLPAPRTSEWDVVDDELPPLPIHHPNLPGAFPQTSSYDHIHSATASSSPRKSTISPPISPDETVKPVFCLRFTSGHKGEASASTLRTRRESSTGHDGGSVGSAAGRRWWSSGSTTQLSQMTATAESDLHVSFVEGKYALPSPATLRRVPSTPRRKSGSRGHGTPLADEEGDTGDEAGSSDDNDSTWSGTQRAVSNPQNPVFSVVVGGEENDIPQDHPVRLTGGTIVVRGVHREIERKALEKVFRALIYTIEVMTLELDLLDAFRVPREQDPLPVPPKDHSVVHSHEPSRSSADLQRRSSVKDKERRSKGLFHRFTRESRGMIDGLFGRSRRESDADYSRSSFERSSSLPASSAVMTATFPATFPSTNSEVSLAPSTEVPQMSSTAPVSTDRHLQVLDRLEKLQVSTTPGLNFPMPAILLRVREEDRVRKEKARQELADDVEGLPPSGTATPRIVSGSSSTPWVDPLRGRALNFRLGGDVRTGLGVLYSAPESFDGWLRLQKLDTLYAFGAPDAGEITLCQLPRPRCFVFWDPVNDSTISSYLDETADDVLDISACNRGSCDVPTGEHLRIWMHAGKRMVMTVERNKEGGEGIDSWVRCAECGVASEPRDVSTLAASYSWGKFIELLLYTRLLQPPDLCPHTQGPDSAPSESIVHHIRTSRVVVGLSQSPVAVFDTRLPKLQVGPNVPKRKPGKAPAVAALDAIAKRDVKEQAVEDVRREIECFFVGMEQRVAVLRERVSAKAGQGDGGQSERVKDELPAEASETNTTQPAEPTESESKYETKKDLVNQGSTDLSTITTDFRQREFTLYDTLTSTPASQLNDARRAFAEAIRESMAQLAEWQKVNNFQEAFETVPIELPDYVTDPKVHPLPGSFVLVREDEPSSLIAYTLSSLAYFTELTRSHTEEPSKVEVGDISIEVKRRDTPRDLLSLRTLAKKRSDASMSLSSVVKPPLALTPNAPSASLVEVTHEQVEGKSQAGDRLGDLVRTISKATAQDPILSVNTARSPSLSESESGVVTTPKIRSPPRLNRRATNESMPPSAFRTSRSVSSNGGPSIPTTPATATSGVSGMTTLSGTSTIGTGGTPSTLGAGTGKDGWSSVTSTFTSSFQQLVKPIKDVGESLGSLKMRSGDRSLSALMGPLSIMSSMDNSLTASIDDRPHLQFSYSIGDRLKLGCTVYHAAAFDSLRRRCAIDKSVITSLARSNIWEAQGGKSKASFFMTSDQKYIVKELVSKWNVSDVHALLEIAPAYLGHLANTHNRATSLAKIIGFYAIRTNDLQTNNKRQLDLLVMENLFYKQNIGQRYDLKGIEGRKVPKATSGGILFDGDWLEGQAKSPILLQPHAKRILSEAVSIDTRFLSSQSVMDYSLLLGLDESRRELVIGLVDAIGSYNLFKTIESRGKQALNRGGEVTVIPPEQYRDRFENAMRQYFVACPDKWSKSRSGVAINTLPSVF